ncbi:hypothetical protein K438DRAFT_1996565 [Mycena galopus ATCC 62051]|nr:hypothetical protein K438DRAFT_1996565 [Mycena galopus ATCC 62051]
MRVTVSRATGYSPYYLLYGVHPVFSFDINEVTWQTLDWHKVRTHEELLAIRAQQLSRRDPKMREANEHIRESRRRAIDDLAKRHQYQFDFADYEEGMYVWLRESKLDETKGDKDNLVDDQPYNSYLRADLCLVYVYEVATEYLLGGERIILPIIHRVYRRDAELRWSEIGIALAGGRFPARYQHTEPNIAPMNHATFQKFIDRFYLADHDGDDQTIFEKGTHLPVQKQHEDYEQILQLMLPIMYSEAELFRFLPHEIAQAALEHRHMWHLDRLARAMIFLALSSCLVSAESTLS